MKTKNSINMKKIVLLLGLMFALQTQIALMAQVTEQNVIFNAHLISTFNLNLVSGGTQVITFGNAADYNAGVVDGVGILPGFTEISVEATEDWYITIECPDFIPGPPLPGTNTIPIENLGVTITEDGEHGLATGEVDYTAIAPDDPQGLTIAAANLIWKGINPDAGDVSDNAFTLHWEMGTQIGTMYALGSMFDQMANGDFTTGDYIATATLTLVQNP